MKVRDIVARLAKEQGLTVQDEEVQRRSLRPVKKVTAGSLSGAVTILAVWAASQYGITVDPEVAQSLTVLVGFVASYWISE